MIGAQTGATTAATGPGGVDAPYYAAIFSSQRRHDDQGYGAMSQLMLDLALGQPGCLGAESARGADGFGITVSYWIDEASIKAWKAVAAHQIAQGLGLSRWYDTYAVRIAKVERAYSSETTQLGAAQHKNATVIQPPTGEDY